VRRTILATAEAIAAEANQIAPSFVQDQGTIAIEVLPATIWGAGQNRVRATFAEAGAEYRDLKVVGAGTARWAAAAIRLACRRLEEGSQIVTEDAGTVVGDQDARRQIVIAAQDDPAGQTSVRLEPSAAAGVYIADEPEIHLHPAAVQSVRSWLSRLSETAAAVFAATHSPALLDSSARQMCRVLVTREHDRTSLKVLGSSLDRDLADVSDVLGISKGELLLLTRLALFVEGPHDQIILGEWFGAGLRAASIGVHPVHGADNLAGLADSEIIGALGIRLATLTDATSVERARSVMPGTTGEKAVARLAREAKRAGREVHVFGLQQPDILYYLDEAICQIAAPAFPGWQVAVDAWSRARRRHRGSWKRWIENQYNLDLSREGVGHLARQCRQAGKVPPEVSTVMESVISLAITKP
jgi:AAA domain, putative AbiEii toxin, Type IV TA system